MPNVYKVTDPTTGRTLRLTGDSPPTEQELEQVFASVHGEAYAEQTQQPPTFHAENAKDEQGNAIVGGVSRAALSMVPGLGVLAQASEMPGAEHARDLIIGAAKGAGSTAIGLGEMVAPVLRKIPGVREYVATPQQFDAAKAAFTTPENTAQRIGKGVEQVGEFFVPTAEAGLLAKVPGLAQAPNALRRGIAATQAAVQTAAQGGGAGESAVSGALSAVLPGGGALQSAAGTVQRSAEQTMADSLRATKEWAKDESSKLAPEMLKRGVGGTFYQMQTRARQMAQKVGQNLGDAYKAAAEAGGTVPGDIVRGNIQLASDALHERNAVGKLIPVPGHEDAIAKLDALQEFVGQLGPNIPVDQAARVKRAWDDIVSRAGLYGNKATASASEKAQAYSFREAATAFRDMLNANPDIADLNKEFSFWAGLRNVMDATKLRKTGQTGGLFRAGAAGLGAAVGATEGETMQERAGNAALYGFVGSQITRLAQSPWWMSKASAPFKQMLADALASGSAEKAAAAAKRLVLAAPAQLREQVSQ